MQSEKFTRYFFAFVAYASCAFVSSIHAAERDLLDALVAKGVLSQIEANELAKESVGVVYSEGYAKTVKLSSRFQLQFENITSELFAGSGSVKYGTPKSGFIVRRFFLQADASLGSGWDTRISVDLARKFVDSVFTDTYLSKKIDGEFLNGKIYFGYMKPGFCYEDVVSSLSTTAIERSTASSYWTLATNGRRLGVGNRYAGVRWNGKVSQVKGLSYIVAVTNSFQLNPEDNEDLAYDYRDNKLAYWLSLHYDINLEDFNLKFGVYSMYSSTANKKMGLGDAASVYSINPYFTGNWKNFFFWGEYLASGVADGRISVSNTYEQANPYGINFSVEYKFDLDDYGKIAPNFRYSWLDTNGRGVQMSDVVRQAGNIGKSYDTAQDYYVGINWYLRGDDLKVQLGYEYVQFSGGVSGNPDQVAEAHAIRLQMQMKL